MRKKNRNELREEMMRSEMARGEIECASNSRLNHEQTAPFGKGYMLKLSLIDGG